MRVTSKLADGAGDMIRQRNMTMVVDFDANLPGCVFECETFIFRLGKREVRCNKEELFNAIERLLND